MGNVAMLLNDLPRWGAGIASIGAQVFVSPDRWVGALNHDGSKHRLQLRNIMPIGPGHDERQRDARTVHQQMALAPIFSPDPSDWGLRFAVPLVLSSLHRQCFAIAKRYPQTRRTQRDPISIVLQRLRPSPTPESARGLRWHYQTARRGVPSTGNRCVIQTRYPQIPVGDLWVCARRQTFVRRPDLQCADALELRKWVHGGCRVLSGLVARQQEEIALMGQ